MRNTKRVTGFKLVCCTRVPLEMIEYIEKSPRPATPLTPLTPHYLQSLSPPWEPYPWIFTFSPQNSMEFLLWTELSLWSAQTSHLGTFTCEFSPWNSRTACQLGPWHPVSQLCQLGSPKFHKTRWSELIRSPIFEAWSYTNRTGRKSVEPVNFILLIVSVWLVGD